MSEEQVYIIDKDGTEIDAANVTMPSNRHFRSAWILSENIIIEDVEMCKDIVRNDIRLARQPLLKNLDAEYMKALESGDVAAQENIATLKQQLRDAPADSNISSATTLEELKAAWNTTILGESPYA